MAVGEVSEPVETGFGFQVFLRTEAGERREFAMEAVRVPTDPNASESDAPEDAPEQPGVGRKAIEKLAGQIKRGEISFSQAMKEHCCPGIKRWTEGRGRAKLEEVLDTLEPGEIVRAPIKVGGSFYLVRKPEPSSPKEPVPKVSVTLPSPKKADVSVLVRMANGKVLANSTRAIKDTIGPFLNISGRRGKYPLPLEFQDLKAPIHPKFFFPFKK